jgi:hypothetical protein
MGASLRIRLAAKASPGKSSRVTAPHAQPPAAIKLRLRRLSCNGLNVTHSAHWCYLPAHCAYLSCLRAALGGGLFSLRPRTPTRVWGVLFCPKVQSELNETSLGFSFHQGDGRNLMDGTHAPEKFETYGSFALGNSTGNRGQLVTWRVESRTGAVTVVSRWILDVAFAAPPQSGLAWFCFLLPSRPGEFRPEPLTDPCLTVSGHTARATPGRLAPSAETIGFLLLPVDPCRSRLASDQPDHALPHR